MRQSVCLRLRNQTQSGSATAIEADVRSVLVDSVHDIFPARGACSKWTTGHLAIARSYGLGPWLCRWFTLHPEAGAPAEILAALKEEHRSAAVQGLVRDVSTRVLLAAFNAAGVPVALLKGSYLVRFVYHDPALRPMEDVDLLVHEEDAQQAEAILFSLGYRSAIKSFSQYHRTFKPALPFYRSNPAPEHIDLHWALQSMDYYRFPAAAVWESAVETDFNGHSVFFLSPEANFIHIGLHTLNHAHSLRNWLDLALSAKKSMLDWDLCVSLAARLGTVRAMRWVFRELARSMRVQPPSHILEQVEAYQPRWIEDRVIARRGRRYWRLYARIERLPGWRSRSDYLLSLALGRIARW